MSFSTKEWVAHFGLSPEVGHHAHYHSMTYDPIRQESVLFGGGTSSETWGVSSGPTWNQKSPVHSPTGRRGHSACWDSHNNRLLIFGGSAAGSWGTRLNDTEAWDGTNWSTVAAASPPGARVMTGGCYDAKRKVFVVCGGWYGTNNSQAVYELDVTTDTWSYWGNGPWERRSHCRLVYDSVNEVSWLVGGYAYPQSSASYRYRDTWHFDGTTWTELSFAGGNDLPVKVNICNSGTDRHHDIFWDSASERICLISNYGSPSKLGLFYLDPSVPRWVEELEGDVIDIAGPGKGWTTAEIPYTDFHEEDNQLYCFFSPTQASETLQTWTLEADSDEDPPVVENQDPAPGATDVAIETDVDLDIVDRGLLASGVDPATVVITIEGVIVWQADAAVNGWSGTKSVISDGFRYALDNPINFGFSQTVTVRAEADDFSGKSVDATYSFTTESSTVWPGHALTVSVNELGIPVPINVWNQFDEHAGLVGLTRLLGEKNWEFKRRTLDTFVHMANCSYQGLVNGITRELGLELFDAINISPILDSDGVPLAPDPYIQFDGAYLLLYSDYTNGLLDWAIDRYQPGGNYEHIGSLITAVNDTSFFEAVARTDLYARSMTILNQSNREQVKMEFIPQSTRFRLKNAYLVQNSVFFSNRQTFKTEMSSVLAVSARGEYHVDYPKGIVTVYTTPNHKEYVRYRYSKIPLVAAASPVILHDINSEAFRVKMFGQILQDDGTYSHGLPTELGVDIINQLIAVSPMYWGV